MSKNEEINELKDTIEDIKNEVIRMKKAQIQMRNNIPDEIKKREQKNEWLNWLKEKEEQRESS